MRPSNEELWYLKKDLVELEKDFSKITCPVYFIHGALDTWVPPGNVDYGKKMLVNAEKVEVTMIPGANHFIPWTKFTEIRVCIVKIVLSKESSNDPFTIHFLFTKLQVLNK